MKKHVKAVLAIVSALVMVMVLTSCGQSAKENSLVMKLSRDRVTLEMTCEAKGDEIVKITQVGTRNFEGAPEGTEEQIKQNCEAAKAKYAKFDFTKYSYEIQDKKVVETISFSTSPEDVEKLKDANLLPLAEDGDRLSLKATKKNLEDAGWQLVKE